MEERPTAVLITTGKNAIRNAISTFGSNPNPNQTSSSGAMATFGMACEETSSGNTERAKGGQRKIASASGTPTTMLNPKPNRISSVVIQVFVSSKFACAASDTSTVLGAGSRNAGMPNRRVTASQSSRSAMTSSVG